MYKNVEEAEKYIREHIDKLLTVSSRKHKLPIEKEYGIVEMPTKSERDVLFSVGFTFRDNQDMTDIMRFFRDLKRLCEARFIPYQVSVHGFHISLYIKRYVKKKDIRETLELNVMPRWAKEMLEHE